MITVLEFVIFILYGITTVILYGFVIAQLLFQKEFKAPFFRIAAVIGFVDLIIYFCIWVYMKLPWCILTGGWFEGKAAETPWNCILLFVYFISYYFPRIRELLILASAFNRYTALAFPFQQKEIWKKWLWPIIALCWIFPFLFSFELLAGTLKIVPFYKSLPKINSYVIDIDLNLPWFPIQNSLINAIHTLIAASLSLFCNLSTLISLYYRNKLKLANGRNNNITVASNKTEANLLIISLWDFVLYFIYTAHQLIMYSFVLRGDIYNPIFDQVYLLMPWIFDALHLSRPFLLIFICKQMRNALFSAIKTKKFIPKIGEDESVTITASSPH